jgi:hypothetical protein
LRRAFLAENQLLTYKDIMRALVLAALVAVFCSSLLSAQEKQSSINPASIYDQDTVTVVSPNQADWVLLQSNRSETVFEKRLKDEILTANVKTIKTRSFETDKDLLINLETLKHEELSKFKRDSIHFYYVRFKGSPCVQYDGIFKLDGASTPKFEYFNIKGYLCRHPDNRDLVIQIEWSNHSNLRGFSENLFSLSNEFFEKTVFRKVTGK